MYSNISEEKKNKYGIDMPKHMNNNSYVSASRMSDREGAGRIKKQPRGGKRFMMKKTYKIEVDCANCALKMEEAAKKVDGVAEATVSFMTQKMKVEFAEGRTRPASCRRCGRHARRWRMTAKSTYDVRHGKDGEFAV